jgi:hypothetical protein
MATRAPLAVVALAALALGACDSAQRAPTSPTSVSSSSVASAPPGVLTIGGRTTIAHPGDTTQLTATMTFPDGATREVTAEARWLVIDDGVLALVTPGLIRAVRYGTTTVTVTYPGPAGQSDRAAIRVAPDGAYLLSGFVQTPAGVRLVNATVEASSRAGTLTSTSDALARYVVPAAGDTVVQAARDGCRQGTRRLSVDRDQELDVELERAAADGDVSGSYRLLFHASPSCSLPGEAMQRTYGARVEEIGQVLYVNVLGKDFVALGEAGFTGTRDGGTVAFVIRDTFDDGYNLIERIVPHGDLYYSGTATGAIREGTIATTFRGTLSLRPAWGVGTSATCSADDHRLELVPVTGG